MRRSLLIGLVALLLAPAGGSAWAQPVPPKSQALLLLRILAYDHNLAHRADGRIVTIVVVYRPGGESEDTANELVNVVREVGKTTTIANNAVQIVRLAYSEKTFDADIVRFKAAALYVSAGLGDNLATITGSTREHKLLSFTGNEDYVGAGVSVGFSLQDSKPTILVNIPSSRSEGADLDAALLRVAKIVKK